MSILAINYLRLLADLAGAQERGSEADEDRLIGELDDVWWQLTPFEHAQIRAATMPRRSVAYARGVSTTMASPPLAARSATMKIEAHSRTAERTAMSAFASLQLNWATP